MYRQIFTPAENDNVISIAIPTEWRGMDVEVVAFPASVNRSNGSTGLAKEKRQRREEMLKKYSFNSNGYKFDRDDANSYE